MADLVQADRRALISMTPAPAREGSTLSASLKDFLQAVDQPSHRLP
ncbi:MAG: hypothetical protein HY748_04665 [Elusimicrobia bacterium]|nr:hypothetical protein [Elusimicrobiota bacterium]